MNLFITCFKRHGKFVDIGCGSGKPVFAAALIHDFKFVQGIEILASLYFHCEEILEAKWPLCVSKLHDFKNQIDVIFSHGDALQISWEDADVVFMNSACFSIAMMEKFASLANGLKTGSFVLTVTKSLPSTDFDLLVSFPMLQTWGISTVHLHKRKQKLNKKDMEKALKALNDYNKLINKVDT